MTRSSPTTPAARFTLSSTTSTHTNPSTIAGWNELALKGVSFTSPDQVRDAIDRFVKIYNVDAAPLSGAKQPFITLTNPFLCGTTKVSAREQ